MNRWKNGKAKFKKEYANPNGSVRSNDLSHVQRIEGETFKEYNPSTSHRHLEQMMMYAELMGNHKNHGIKSLWDNKMLADILEAKELLDTANVAMDGRIMTLGSAQWNDLFNITGFTSKDFIDQMFVPAGSPLNTGNVPNTLLGFEPKMTTVSGNTAYFNHPSFLTVAFQQNLEISVHDQRVIGLRGDRVTADILWGVKQLDDERVVTIS